MLHETNNYLLGNERLQEMMGIMAEERGSKVFATDERSEPLLQTAKICIFTASSDSVSTMGSWLLRLAS